MTENSDLPESSNHEGRLIRKADTLSVMFYIYHNLGIQSNVVVSAKYSNSNALLTPSKVRRALKKVINQHPALSIIGVTRPSIKNPGHHRTWEGHLPVINFRDCVEFRDVDLDSDEQLSSIIAGIHNTWFDTKDKTKPLWKLVVLNQKTVVFAFHHFISDGLSGYAFHRALTSALNEEDGVPNETEDGMDSESVTTPRIDPAALHHPMYELEEKLSWPSVISGFLFWILIRLIFSSTSFFFSNIKMPLTLPTVAKPLPGSEKTITRVRILRIHASTMSKALSGCRSHETSFSALLLTLVQITLAAEEYPQAKFGFSRLAISVRDLLKKENRIGKDEMVNASASYFGAHRLGRFREADNGMSSTAGKTGNEGKEQVWESAKQFKSDINKDLYVDKNTQKALCQCKLMGEDDEEVGKFTGMALYQKNSFLVSNLGAFEPKEPRDSKEMVEEEGGEGKWKVKDILFSVGAVNANIYSPMAFNVASAKGGDCVICANWQEGVLEEKIEGYLVEVVAELSTNFAIMVKLSLFFLSSNPSGY
ncbi:uncharacterized protein PAC_11289 [Phialocephala subalpina]|uniref:Diacylglycerol O-acyltransferase n=1 Tax=Phialocephala subalpina TaxID=576137 RepID=A0A1L7X8P2_9HELO|nr:uncharacterized protein PAC_11289 [Phialocephala subalpina]